jgi:RNA polymerase sigma-70 factor (ECF subfamily)
MFGAAICDPRTEKLTEPLLPEPSSRAEADLALAAACAAGDPAAWDRLVEAHAGQVTGAVRAALGRSGLRDGSLEDELVADTFATVAADGGRALRGFQGKASLGTFLAVIATRVVGRALRRRGSEARARRALAERTLRSGEGAAEGGNDASAQAEASERAAAVADALAELKPRDRLMLSLFYEEGKSYKEIAAVLGIAATGVGTEIARARQRIARRLEARGAGGEAES